MTAPRPLLPKSPLLSSGLLAALGTHAVWGSMPLYLLLVRQVPVFEFVAWRTLFTLPVCLLALAWTGSWREVRSVLADRRAMRRLLGSAAMIAINWCLFVWAIQSGQVYAASLGYYILPLAMMLLGLMVLGERLTLRQWTAVALAGAAVAALASGALTTLWVSLSLAITFAVYGLIRKTVSAGPLVGLAVESLLLLPFAAAIVGWYAMSAQGSALGRDGLETFAILLAGPLTALPLMLFAFAARAMPYSVIGILQFISPTIVFVLGLTVFGEELRATQLASFIAIWAAVAVFAWGLLRGGGPAVDDGPGSRGAAA